MEPNILTMSGVGAHDVTYQRARPFLKWAGGKTQLLNEILPRLPEHIETYFEPFIGGGAVFFALANEGRFNRAVIGDRNPALIEVYSIVRDDVEALITALREHAPNALDEDYYYRLRAVDPLTLGAVARAARMIFVNKTCFNGLWRVNRAGKFNVPSGRYKNPRVLDEELLRAASHALQGVQFVASDFEETVHPATRGDAVYFDPPYYPLTKTSSFTAYDLFPFREIEHERLARVYQEVRMRGAVAVLSNSWCPYTCELYSAFPCHQVQAKRNINSVGEKRGKISELLVADSAVETTKNYYGEH